jgi:hypothetical protein
VPVALGTIVAKTHLPYARVLARSLRQHHPDVPLHVLLADEVDDCFDPGQEPFELLLLRDLEVPNNDRFRFSHEKQPLSYAATPYLLEALLNRGFRRTLFIKQESLVTGPLDPAIELLDRCAILLTPHLVHPLEGPDRVARELNILQSGAFNVGLIGVSESNAARSFLRWWQDRVYAHCRHAILEGMHYEQRWVDLVPAFFEDVCVLRDPAANVGHWNLPERRSIPVRLLRFSGFDPDRPESVTRYSDRVSIDDLRDLAETFAEYAEKLKEAGWEEARRWPYAYDQFDNGVPIPELAREVYAALGADADRFGSPFATSGSGSYFHWLNEPVDGERRVSRLWLEIHARRADLHAAFPDPTGDDADGFVAWTAASGAHEHAIPAAFLLR